MRGVSAADAAPRVAHALKLVQLTGQEHKLPGQLSGGQQQRVAIARAIVIEPPLILMDEPLSNLDAALRIDTRAQLQKLHQRIKRTTVYVTHDQVEAMTMGDRIAVMKDGILQQLDTPQVLHDRPANLFVAGFIGSPAMNFFPAKVVGTAEGALADAGFFKAPLKAGAGKHLGKDVVVGVRPEDIEDLGHSSQNGQLPLDAHVEVVEFLGNEYQLHLTAPGAEKSFIARVGTETRTQPGANIRIGFDVSKLHMFDRATEQSLT